MKSAFYNKTYYVGGNSIYLICLLILSMVKLPNTIQIQESFEADDNFDKIYMVYNGRQTHYLKVYCVQKNMISVSITRKQIFEECPRFPIHSPKHQQAKFQRKLYSLFSACNIDVTIEKNNQLVLLSHADNHLPIFAIKEYSYSNNIIQISTQDLSIKWGMGERFQNHFTIQDGTWTVWNRDRPWVIDEGLNSKSMQTYGHQPVYLAYENMSGLYHLVYFKNTFAFNYQSTTHSRYIKYTATGGPIQFIIITGYTPEQVLKQYHSYIGPAMVPPFWSLGFHQSRWGYKNFEQLSSVVSQYEKYHLPLDTIWTDLDYMDKKQIFTLDNSKFPASKMTSLMKQKDIHYIPLIDVGVSINDEIGIRSGLQSNVFLKSLTNSNQPYQGKVWPGSVHFVDFLHPNASDYWCSQLNRLYELIPFSGVWLDMNEPANFQGNEHVAEQYKVQHLQSITMMTINVNLQHYHPNHLLKHSEVHAYYGHLSTVPTYQFLKQKNGRPFIISRSNSVGTGYYAGHWTGDNVANWEFLRLSIGGNFLFQIFGIQMVGADICGFRYNTNEELCARWMQVGSLYPFARNHNQNESIPQQPYKFGNTLLQTSKLSLYQRYSLLKQMYSTLVELNGTGSFYRPLIFQYPRDSQAFVSKFLQTQFLIGDYLMGAPILDKGTNQRDIYIPQSNIKETWYELTINQRHGVTVPNQFKHFQSSTINKILNPLPSAPPIFIRSGKLILTNAPATRVSLLDNHYNLIAALQDNKAKGSFLAIKNFTNNLQIDACVAKGCSMAFSVTWATQREIMLQWNYLGNTSVQIDITIQQVKILKDAILFTSIKKLVINTTNGKQNLISLS